MECGAGHAPGTLSVCCTGPNVLAMHVCIVVLVVHLALLHAALVILCMCCSAGHVPGTECLLHLSYVLVIYDMGCLACT